MNWIPGVSQLKSTVQALTGDLEGAKQTQKDFFQQCPGVSQVTSAVQVLAGDVDGAVETQKKCLGTVNNVVNSIPVVGHAKALAHAACGDQDGAAQALKSSNRITGDLAGGAVGYLVAGTVGAVAGGVAMDTLQSSVEEKSKHTKDSEN